MGKEGRVQSGRMKVGRGRGGRWKLRAAAGGVRDIQERGEHARSWRWGW